MTYSLIELLTLGGPVMWPLVVCLILVVAIVAERGLALASASSKTQRFLGEVMDSVKRHKLAEALAACDRMRGPIAHMVRVGLSKHGQGREEIRQAIEEAGRRQVPGLERNLTALATIAHVAPLLGLLGTTVGLIQCFQVIQSKAAALQPIGPVDLAQGVWQALLTTTAGLAVAIPAIIGYNYFVRRVQRLVGDMQSTATDLINVMIGDSTT